MIDRDNFIEHFTMRMKAILYAGLTPSTDEMKRLESAQILLNNHINHILGASEDVRFEGNLGGCGEEPLETA